jgi:CII-binding regulator of phage lambda lysogenization HflD
MTPEEFNTQLQVLMNFLSDSFHRSDERFERIYATLETIVTRVDQNTVQINELGVRMDQVTLQIQQTNATVASVARLLERHIRDGHGPKPKRKKKK